MQWNAFQVACYQKLLDYMSDRKVEYSSLKHENVRFVKADESERMFLDALQVILMSGYAIEEQDFLELLEVVCKSWATSVSETRKIQILNFFRYAS